MNAHPFCWWVFQHAKVQKRCVSNTTNTSFLQFISKRLDATAVNYKYIVAASTIGRS